MERPRIGRRIRTIGHSNFQVKLLGQLGADEVLERIDASDLFLFASRCEAFGITLIGE